MGRKQTFTTLGQTVLRGKARPINHFTIPSDRGFPATPTALTLILHVHLFRGPKCMKTSLPHSALAAYWFIFAPRCPTTYSTHTRTHIHTHLGLGGEETKGGGRQEGFVGRWLSKTSLRISSGQRWQRVDTRRLYWRSTATDRPWKRVRDSRRYVVSPICQ